MIFKEQKNKVVLSFLVFLAFTLDFYCQIFCQLTTTCLLLMKQKLYALDAFFVEKIKLSENDSDVGETERTTGERVKEHLADIKHKREKAVAVHFNAEEHTFKDLKFLI